MYALSIAIASCGSKVEEIVENEDKCAYCKMVIVDSRFAGEIITKKGKIFKFDDIGKCLVEFYKEHRDDVKEVYVVDFESKKLVRAERAFFLWHPSLKTPMDGKVIAFSERDELEAFVEENALKDARILKFEELVR